MRSRARRLRARARAMGGGTPIRGSNQGKAAFLYAECARHQEGGTAERLNDRLNQHRIRQSTG